ncbi:MAG: hypothetical protein FJX18_02220 [Alphaproteobacteria bacterium]|nr:hypothetical protein [Alphaproteobacteria bacterium]
MTLDQSKFQRLMPAILIAGGLTLGGYFIGKGVGMGLTKFRANIHHTVQVKGISERQLKSDFAVWKIAFRSAGKNFQEARDRFYESHKILLDFLKEGGFDPEEISEEAPGTTIEYHGGGGYEAHAKEGKFPSYYFWENFLCAPRAWI